ncbi:MAG: arsenic metallochaperone ArsD family protein [Candidatus Omnitrophica bacterium]|nr:arsenic metallochaperone ArsD family protein [Candidatus Omnitrophota bacterium]
MTEKKTVKIFTMEQQFPCGPNSSCCGPIGQSEEEISALKSNIENLGFEVEVYNVQKAKVVQENPQIFKLLHTFGPMAVPIITIGDEIASIGQAEIDEIVTTIKTKIGG